MDERDGRGLPRTIANPDMGMSTTFLVTAEESEDGHVESRVTIPGHEPGPPRHRHTDFTETFTVVEGRLHMDLGDQRGLVLGPGESVHVPIGVVHRYFNAGDEQAIFDFRADPGHRYEQGIRAATGLSNAGRTNARGIPRNPLEMALLFELAGTYPTGVPVRVQQALARCVGCVARWRGYDPTFEAYLGRQA